MEIKPGYKDIVNYLRNELEITRDYIHEVVEKSIANAVKQCIEERLTDGRLDREVANAVRQVTTDSKAADWRNPSSKEAFEKAVLAAVGPKVGKFLTDEFNIEFSISPRNKTFHAAAVAAVLNGDASTEVKGK